MPLVKKVSYALVFVLFVAAVRLHLGPGILAGLFSYMILDLTHRLFVKRLSPGFSRWLALFVFLVAATAISAMFARFIRQTIHTLPQIAATAIPKLIVISESYGIDLPFENVYELREVVIKEIKDNADSITKTSGLLTIGFFRIVIAVFIAILCFFCEPQDNYEEDLFDVLRREFNERLRTFMLSFEKVFGAQLVISMINTLLTAVFVSIMGFPHAVFLVLATFLLGILPIVGNILSNTIIVGTALTISLRHALFALGFLILIHKGEYILNSRVVGTRINVPMWQTLLVLMVGEVVMGIPGIILAPALLHYVKEELRGIPAAEFQMGPRG